MYSYLSYQSDRFLHYQPVEETLDCALTAKWLDGNFCVQCPMNANSVNNSWIFG